MCIARALAVDPEVLLLMDEPASCARSCVSTSKIEDLIFQLKREYTIVIVTHNMQQAARVAENTGFFLNGQAGGVRFRPTRSLPILRRQAHRGLHHGEVWLMGGTRIKFQQSLDDLKERLLEMAGLAEQAIQPIHRGPIAHATRPSGQAGLPQVSRPSTGWSERSTRWRWTCWRWSSRWPLTCGSSFQSFASTRTWNAWAIRP